MGLSDIFQWCSLIFAQCAIRVHLSCCSHCMPHLEKVCAWSASWRSKSCLGRKQLRRMCHSTKSLQKGCMMYRTWQMKKSTMTKKRKNTQNQVNMIPKSRSWHKGKSLRSSRKVNQPGEGEQSGGEGAVACPLVQTVTCPRTVAAKTVCLV